MMLFQSADRRFGLRLDARDVKKITKLCRRAFPNETGGILIGRYNERHDLAEITGISPPPPDSHQAPTAFYRGVQGLQRCLQRLWHGKRQYYIGEWHFHPLGTPEPSGRDAAQMRDIATAKNYRCPEPVLLIVAGTAERPLDFGAYVCLESGGPLKLAAQESPT